MAVGNSARRQAHARSTAPRARVSVARGSNERVTRRALRSDAGPPAAWLVDRDLLASRGQTGHRQTGLDRAQRDEPSAQTACNLGAVAQLGSGDKAGAR